MSQNTQNDSHHDSQKAYKADSENKIAQKSKIINQAIIKQNKVIKLKGNESVRQKDSIINLKSEKAYFDSPSAYGINTPKHPMLDRMTFNITGSNNIQTLMNNSNNYT